MKPIEAFASYLPQTKYCRPNEYAREIIKRAPRKFDHAIAISARLRAIDDAPRPAYGEPGYGEWYNARDAVLNEFKAECCAVTASLGWRGLFDSVDHWSPRTGEHSHRVGEIHQRFNGNQYLGEFVTWPWDK